MSLFRSEPVWPQVAHFQPTSQPAVLTNGDVWYDNSANILKGQINGSVQPIGGISQNTPGIPSSNGPGVIYASNYGVVANGHAVPDASSINGSPNISCPNSDCHFLTTAKVGQTIWMTSSCSTGSSDPQPLAETTILSVTDDNHLVASANAGVTRTGTGCLVWGNLDQNSSLTGAWTTVMNAVNTALLNGPVSLYLPCGLSLVEGPVNFAAQTVLFPVSIMGCGQPSSMLVPSPNFTIGAATTAFFNGLSMSGSEGQIQAHDFEIWGAGYNGANCPGASVTGLLIGSNWYAQNIIVNAWCGSHLLNAITSSAFLGINIQTDFSAGMTWNAFGQPSTCIACFAGDTPAGLKLTGTGTFTSINGTYGAGGCAQSVSITSNGVVYNAKGDEIQTGLNLNDTTAIVNLDNANVSATNCTSQGAIKFGTGAGGGKVTLSNYTKLAVSGTTQDAITGTGTITTDGTSTIQVGTTGYAVSTVTFNGTGVGVGIGTGTCSSSTTLFLNSTGAASSLCTNTTSTTTLFTAPFTGTLSNLVCTAATGGTNSSSGAVTVRTAPVSTGTFSNTLITGTFGTSTSASDATHTASVTVGQPVQIQVTTQATETLAGVICSVLLHN